MSRTQRMTTITMLTAISILFHMIESMIPVPVPVPGFKLGLANIVALIAYYLFDAKVMLSVNLMRVVLASLLRGMLFGTGFWLSMCGVLLSTLACILARRTPMSIYGVSVGGKQCACHWTGDCSNADLSAILYAGDPAGIDSAGHPDGTVCGTCRKSSSETNTHRMIAVI